MQAIVEHVEERLSRQPFDTSLILAQDVSKQMVVHCGFVAQLPAHEQTLGMLALQSQTRTFYAEKLNYKE